MLRTLVRAIETWVLLLAAYNLVTALWGWRDRLPAPSTTPQRRMLVVVPAHNEEKVIERVCRDALDQNYPGELFETWVVADRSTDRTAEIARTAGARVVEREEGPDGKGAVLSWFLNRRPLGWNEALVVVDADNRIPAGMLRRLSAELDAGHTVLQAYLDVSNPDASLVATASALSYWASNRMVQQARRNLGWSADLGGTGMCFTADALKQAGGFGNSLTEDQDLAARLVLAGHPITWLHDLRVADEKPAEVEVAVGQRARWAAGKRAVTRTLVPQLLLNRGAPAVDLAIRLMQPGRMLMVLFAAALAVVAALDGSPPLLPWWVWTMVVAIQVLAPIPFLVKDKVPGRYLARYPALLLLPLIKLAGRFRRQRGWYHTPHG